MDFEKTLKKKRKFKTQQNCTYGFCERIMEVIEDSHKESTEMKEPTQSEIRV